MDPAPFAQQQPATALSQSSQQQVPPQQFLCQPFSQAAPTAQIRTSALPAGLAPQGIAGGPPPPAVLPALPHLPIPVQGSTPRPAGGVSPSSFVPQPMGIPHPRPSQPVPPPQFPSAMLPMLGYPLPLLQSVQNISIEELSKSTGIPLTLLQAQPQMQLAARQIMLQRIMAFQLQAQQVQQQQQQQQQQQPLPPQQMSKPSLQQQVPQQHGGPSASKSKAPSKPKSAAKQQKAPTLSQPRRQQAQPSESDGMAGNGEIGGKVVWAKIGSYPWWPAKTLGESDPSLPADADPPRPTSIPIRFFGTYDFCWIGSKRALADWEEAYDDHIDSCKQDSFTKAVEEVEHFNKTGELPQVFYMRPPPEGRSRARGRRRARPRSGGVIGSPAVGDDALATPSTGPSAASKQRSGKQPLEDRTMLACSRRKRLMQELGLAPPSDSPYSETRICPNPALIELQQEFHKQWPPSDRPLISTNSMCHRSGHNLAPAITPTPQPYVQAPQSKADCSGGNTVFPPPHSSAAGCNPSLINGGGSCEFGDGSIISVPTHGQQFLGSLKGASHSPALHNMNSQSSNP